MEPFVSPSFLRPINASQMRHANRSIILDMIRTQSPVARSEISRALNLSMPTVMRIVNELAAEGLVRPTGETTGESGRPREMLEFNGDGHTVIGVDLGGTNLYAALATIGGEILTEAHRVQHKSSGERSYKLVEELIRELMDSPKGNGRNLIGIAVGAPGVTHSKQGVVEWAPSLNWRDFPLKKRLEEKFTLPVAVENDVNLAVLGEQWFGKGKGVNNMVLIAIGTGVGAGLIIDGAIYRGHHESAGEVGYLLPGSSALGKRYDQFGALESIISGTGVAKRARMVTGKAYSSMEVFEAAREGNEWAKKIVDETVDQLSVAIANIATLLDPELIVLGGGVSNSADLLIPAVLKRITGTIQHIPRIEASSLGPKATVMGAITLTVHTTKDFYVVRKLN